MAGCQRKWAGGSTLLNQLSQITACDRFMAIGYMAEVCNIYRQASESESELIDNQVG